MAVPMKKKRPLPDAPELVPRTAKLRCSKDIQQLQNSCLDLVTATISPSKPDLETYNSSTSGAKSNRPPEPGLPPVYLSSDLIAPGDIDNEEPEVCFGTICDITMRLSIDESSAQTSGVTTGRFDASKLAITKNRMCYAISYGDVKVGAVSTILHDSLRVLENFGTIRRELEVDPLAFEASIKTWKNKGKKLDLDLQINLFGPPSIKDAIGRSLSDSRIYLQQPRLLGVDTIVDNPHMIKFPHLSNENEHEPPSCNSLIAIGPSDVQIPDVCLVLEGLDQSGILDTANVNSCIISTLLDHQLRGLNFIVQRESSAPPMPQLSLWDNSKSGQADTWHFRHKITNSVSRAPTEAFGGIIADDMGLGKTLTMLSNIVATIPMAYAYSESHDATQSSTRLSKATLVVVPSVQLLDNWVSEIKKHLAPSSLSVHRYHGSSKSQSISKLLKYDVVVTTYGTITAEFSGICRLHQISWFRIVFDEAHTIRNQNTKFFRAIASLQGKIRWCLTGTPIQNKLEDLAALVRFVQVPCLLTLKDFKKYCIEPVKRRGADGFDKIRALLQIICIRRTQELLQLPKHETIEHVLQLSEFERSEYLKVRKAYKTAIDDAIYGRKTTDAYSSILKALQDLRLICNHGRLPITTASLIEDTGKGQKVLSRAEETSCVYCGIEIAALGQEEDSPAVRMPSCTHLTWSGCLDTYLADLEKSADCSTCSRSQQKTVGVSPQTMVGESKETEQPDDFISTKLEKISGDVRAHRKTDKCIVFSYWKQTLRGIGLMLSKQEIPFVQLDGSLSASARQEVLRSFREDPQTTILLMTLGTGAVGLNLTIATRIHLVEPQWNPTIESQAIGHALRFGQNQRVTIIRYIMKDTVEEQIQSLQGRKLELSNLGFGQNGKTTKDEKLTKLNDLRQVIGV